MWNFGNICNKSSKSYSKSWWFDFWKRCKIHFEYRHFTNRYVCFWKRYKHDCWRKTPCFANQLWYKRNTNQFWYKQSFDCWTFEWICFEGYNFKQKICTGSKVYDWFRTFVKPKRFVWKQRLFTKLWNKLQFIFCNKSHIHNQFWQQRRKQRKWQNSSLWWRKNKFTNSFKIRIHIWRLGIWRITKWPKNTQSSIANLLGRHNRTWKHCKTWTDNHIQSKIFTGYNKGEYRILHTKFDKRLHPQSSCGNFCCNRKQIENWNSARQNKSESFAKWHKHKNNHIAKSKSCRLYTWRQQSKSSAWNKQCKRKRWKYIQSISFT